MFRAGTLALAIFLACAVSAAAETQPTDLSKAGAARIRVTGDWLAAGGGAIWMSWSNAVLRLDPRTGRVVTRVSVPQGPCEGTIFNFGYVWTATCQKHGVARIDPRTNRAEWVPVRIPAGFDGEGSIGAGAGSVWVVTDGDSCSRCIVSRVSAKTLEVLAQTPVDDGAAAVRFGLGDVWVTNPNRNIVTKIDPASNAVVAKTRVSGQPRFLAVGEGGVWVLSQDDGKVTRLDPKTGRVVSRIPAQVVGEGGEITTGAGWVWPRGSGYLLTRIDPRTNRVVERYGPSLGSGGVIVGYGAVWVTAHDVGTLFRLPLSKI